MTRLNMEKGVTLMELLVVIMILGMLLFIVLPGSGPQS